MNMISCPARLPSAVTDTVLRAHLRSSVILMKSPYCCPALTSDITLLADEEAKKNF